MASSGGVKVLKVEDAGEYGAKLEATGTGCGRLCTCTLNVVFYYNTEDVPWYSPLSLHYNNPPLEKQDKNISFLFLLSDCPRT